MKLLLSANFIETQSQRLAQVAPQIETIALGPDLDHADLDLAFFSPDCYPDLAAEFMTASLKASNLEWLQTFSAGVDHPVFSALIERGCQVTTASGAAAVPIAHSIVMNMLALGRRLPETMANQTNLVWDKLDGRDLAGTTTVILGMGPIGLELARLLPAFGTKVIGLRRSVKGDEPCETWALDRLPEALAMADQLVLALPLTEETNQIIDSEALQIVPDSCFVVNVGRGALIDEAALIKACREERIGGIALDVFEVEPLPSDNPLWSLPNSILTPHMAARVPATDLAAIEIFFDNLTRFCAGDDLVNRV